MIEFFLLSLVLLILGLVLVGFIAVRSIKAAPVWLKIVGVAAYIGYAVLLVGFVALFSVGAAAVPVAVNVDGAVVGFDLECGEDRRFASSFLPAYKKR